VVDSRWSTLARTDVIAFSRQGQRQYAAFLGGGAVTSLVSLPTTSSEWAQVDHEVGLFPYRIAPRERVLIIGAGGGFDVLLALRGGAQAITAVEINVDILQAVERFNPASTECVSSAGSPAGPWGRAADGPSHHPNL
jgi:spermidine synthase